MLRYLTYGIAHMCDYPMARGWLLSKGLNLSSCRVWIWAESRIIARDKRKRSVGCIHPPSGGKRTTARKVFPNLHLTNTSDNETITNSYPLIISQRKGLESSLHALLKTSSCFKTQTS
jgi:hypothetical protein